MFVSNYFLDSLLVTDTIFLLISLRISWGFYVSLKILFCLFWTICSVFQVFLKYLAILRYLRMSQQIWLQMGFCRAGLEIFTLGQLVKKWPLHWKLLMSKC